jgi:hypothetical protein
MVFIKKRLSPQCPHLLWQSFRPLTSAICVDESWRRTGTLHNLVTLSRAQARQLARMLEVLLEIKGEV